MQAFETSSTLALVTRLNLLLTVDQKVKYFNLKSINNQSS
ncbi:hypothetical protein NSP_42860 [Nodularia spumigena CCY9414]|nr:hypothetical protein NSP_42860 [Nodularia spumigena CCY9414]